MADLLKAQLDHETIFVVTTVFGLILRRDPVTQRCPDLAVFIRASIVERDGYIHPAPELIVEVLAPGETRDNVSRKLRDYESIAVPEVWVISPEAQTIEVLLLQEGRLITTSLPREGQLAPTRFPKALVTFPRSGSNKKRRVR